ncbi:epoxide hydrolase [Phlyctema vagabunda]|uniref:Epoxide hydrolase n=1 Tax=Phlyctema vagabunda TaxID=108571 RepID=A0ABR4P654_9HELO
MRQIPYVQYSPNFSFLMGSSCLNIQALTFQQTDIANTSYVNWVRSLTNSNGTTYRYVFSPPFESDKPYLMFLHGFPESSYEWRYQIEYFKEQGYGIIAPDLLGYGGTDSPSDLASFSYKNMVSDLSQLLDCEKIDKVVGISHDFGSSLLSRFITYESDRLLAVAFLDIGYVPPGTVLDEMTVTALNNATLNSLGYTLYGYWVFHNEDDAASIIDTHLDSFFSLVYTYNMTYWKEFFTPLGEFKQWLLDDRRAPVGKFSTTQVSEQWKSIMRAQGGLDGPLKWYKSSMRGINRADEEAVRSVSATIQQPVLLILADQDPVGIPSSQLNLTVPYAPNLTVRSINSGHFVEVEAPQEVNKHLDCFLQTALRTPPGDFVPIDCT